MSNAINELEILLTPQRGIIQKLTESEIEAVKSAIKALEERPQGEWLITWESDEFVCKECKSNVKQPTMMGKPAFKFCPYCGADMRKGAHND